MGDAIGSKKKILKNTIILYVRMIVTMLIALYTSRVVLKALGIEDYGLYNVVGGIVTLFSFLKTSIASATQRFLSFELGRASEESDTNRVFCASVTTHILLTVVIVIFCETLGLWLLNSQINIPPSREYAANAIYHFSVISICVSMLNVPYHACVISHENMRFFAFVSILDALLKLVIAIAVTQVTSIDKLMIYGFLVMLIAIVNQIIYYVFCRKSYSECKYKYSWDRRMMGRIFGFSSWTLLGQLAVMASGQGASILVNIFYSVSANAAIGIAQQVNNAISGLVANFQTAYQPQITKAYAANNFEYQKQLILQASKVSYFLMFVISLPVIFNIDDLLTLWLVKVPEYTNQFCLYYMAASMLNAIGGPLWMSIFATGNIKHYQIATSIAYMLDIVIVYLLFLIGFPPVTAVAVLAFVNAALVIIRIIYCKIAIPFFSVRDFTKMVISPLVACTVLSVLLGYAVFYYAQTPLLKLLASSLTLLFSLYIFYALGLNRNEKYELIRIIRNKISKQ